MLLLPAARSNDDQTGQIAEFAGEYVAALPARESPVRDARKTLVSLSALQEVGRIRGGMRPLSLFGAEHH